MERRAAPEGAESGKELATPASMANNCVRMAIARWLRVVSSVTTLVAAAPLAAQTAVAKAPPELASRAVTGTFKPQVIGGFRMEGAPEVEVVFGDTMAYRARIDRFFQLDTAMNEQRQSFSRRVQASLAALVQSKRGCPTQELAPHYFGAYHAAEEYRRLGIALEIEYTAIQTLHRFGESQGLTPDYRWKVNRVTPAYRASLTDYREIQVALVEQLDKELGYRGCKSADLLSEGEKRADTPPLAYTVPVPPPRRTWRREAPAPVVPASTATFTIDNRSCKDGLDVYADGVLLGEAPAHKRAAFQTLTGNRAICLIPKGSTLECGQAETVRTAYIHDGWAMTMHCKTAATTPEPAAKAQR